MELPEAIPLPEEALPVVQAVIEQMARMEEQMARLRVGTITMVLRLCDLDAAPEDYILSNSATDPDRFFLQRRPSD